MQFSPRLCNPRWRQCNSCGNKNLRNYLRTYKLELQSLSLLCQLSLKVREMLKCMSLWKITVTKPLLRVWWFRFRRFWVLLRAPAFVQSFLELDKIPKNNTLYAVVCTCVITWCKCIYEQPLLPGSCTSTLFRYSFSGKRDSQNNWLQTCTQTMCVLWRLLVMYWYKQFVNISEGGCLRRRGKGA